MSRVAYLVVACDTDPDASLEFRRLPSGVTPDKHWSGVCVGIDRLRARLLETTLFRRVGPLPITWLLRADRQIREIYGSAAFAFQRFADVWEREQRLGAEIGWHPHLYRWDEDVGAWQAWLGRDDDVEILRDCLAALREHTDVRSARTGWVYHSNRLMDLFAREGIRVDGSAIPGSVHLGRWRHDWTATPRVPYRPSRNDYRVAAPSDADAVGVCELPVAVRRLSSPLQAVRYLTRRRRRLGSNWEAARWQGVLITHHDRPFEEAVAQTLDLSDHAGEAFVVTYFHTGELLRRDAVERFAANLDVTVALADRGGWELRPVTFSAAGSAAERAFGASGAAA